MESSAAPRSTGKRKAKKYEVVYLPSVATMFLQPLSDLWALMNARTNAKSQEGLPAAFILLAYTVAESWAARNRCELKDRFPRKASAQPPKDGWDLLSALSKSGAGKRLQRKAKEFKVVRDAIAHGHLYEHIQVWTEDSNMKLRRGRWLHGRERKDLEQLIHTKTRTMRKLRIHYVPAELTQEDCRPIAGILGEIFRHFAKSGSLSPNHNGWHVIFPYLTSSRKGAHFVTPSQLFSIIERGLTTLGPGDFDHKLG